MAQLPNDEFPDDIKDDEKEKEKEKEKGKGKEKEKGKKKNQNPNYGRILLAKHLKELEKHSEGFSVGLVDDDNLYEWQVIVEGPPNTLYEGGYFQAKLSFPPEFPNKPPVMQFVTPGFWHPNVYKDGKVCISILHEAKEDPFNQQESMDEKWRPIISVEAILISVMSMLSEPNFDSPANIDASVQWKKDPEGFKKRVREVVRKSQELMMGA
jgi:ubiquitin-conjugating enzyme E2 G1